MSVVVRSKRDELQEWLVTILVSDSSCLPHLKSALVDQTISKYGGRIVGRNGDELIAVFGIEEPHGNAAGPVKAAQALQRKFRGFVSAGASLRIGIITGEVILHVGDDGSYEVEGDAVDVAARLCKVAVGRSEG